jgi:hypothetical protein
MIKPQSMGSMYLRDQIAYQTVVAYRGRKRSARTVSKLKRKAIPVEAWTFSDGSRSLRLPDIKKIGT